ncbi:MAG TPA: protein-L-isoaspartate(D-aspartate) O-methyltransferase [Croceibacterium sp.]
MASPAENRAWMVARQLKRRGIRNPHVLAAMAEVPRERFVPASLAEVAYQDGPLPIGEEQTISQPYVVALMTEAADVAPGDHVLEVGAGSGYAAAVLSRIAGRVYALERHETLARAAQRRVAELGYSNLAVLIGDGSLGLPAHAPYDAILVAAGSAQVPEPLKRQLAIGGRLVIPIGSTNEQVLLSILRRGDDEWTEDELGAVRFVPLIGAHGC